MVLDYQSIIIVVEAVAVVVVEVVAAGPHVGFQKGEGEICKTPLIWATSN